MGEILTTLGAFLALIVFILVMLGGVMFVGSLFGGVVNWLMEPARRRDEARVAEQHVIDLAVQEWKYEQQEDKERRRQEKEQWRRERAQSDAELKQLMDEIDRLTAESERMEAENQQLMEDFRQHQAKSERLGAELRKQTSRHRT